MAKSQQYQKDVPAPEPTPEEVPVSIEEKIIAPNEAMKANIKKLADMMPPAIDAFSIEGKSYRDEVRRALDFKIPEGCPEELKAGLKALGIDWNDVPASMKLKLLKAPAAGSISREKFDASYDALKEVLASMKHILDAEYRSYDIAPGRAGPAPAAPAKGISEEDMRAWQVRQEGEIWYYHSLKSGRDGATQHLSNIKRQIDAFNEERKA